MCISPHFFLTRQSYAKYVGDIDLRIPVSKLVP